MESWRKVWRDGLARHLSTAGLRALARALSTDDARIIQGTTTVPPPLQCVHNWPVEAACVLAYCAWQGDGLRTVAQVEEFVAGLCYEADQVLGEPAACRYFLNWYDETPRAQMRTELLDEVRLALAQRRAAPLEPASDEAVTAA